MPFQSIFIDEENKQRYSRKVLSWLKSDFERREDPASSHFWHNERIIAQAFEGCNALVVIDTHKRLVGYMIWARDEVSAEIEIVEVIEKFRRQGVFKKMLSDFLDKFTNVSILFATVLPQAREIFRQAGWQMTQDLNGDEKFYRIIKPSLCPVDTLPDGRAIAIFSNVDVIGPRPHIDSGRYVDFYVVKANPSHYPLKYFQIDLDETGKLRIPLITNFHHEGYIGVYFNKKLIAQGKAKHLFEGRTAFSDSSFLIISRIVPVSPKLFYDQGFFPARKDFEGKERSSSLEESSKIVTEDTARVTPSEPPEKKSRIGSPLTLFSRVKSEIQEKTETPIVGPKI
ncbi:MAG: hypothetical protein A3C55_06310 [Gammaproteobacteria bacterium RIFCSPHIGHO2_02_FULL_42_13]|nr:MAG: hypothetical protein A3C55_06310 [Gammaproteobacteria bacterium RIFCSPHIGHO2_02_FULL_42_13]OGT70436.1 MAG: hypothetical protein A3H43_06010 [Gammaproteobacteria bacterium RIFCSPLOWO2_02_FULL_42_9]